MIGIVIVSHSDRLAQGVAELAREMGGQQIRLETAGGLDMPGHPIGTDAVLVMQAIERAWSDDGVLVLMDLGSAVLSAEMALDMLDEERRGSILLCEAPLVEGAVAAAVTARMGSTLEAAAAEARGGLAGKVAHLGAAPREDLSAVTDTRTDAVTTTLTIDIPHGLHARPAARFVQTASRSEAAVSVRNLTADRGPADARSLNAIATLGAAFGHEIEISATGPGAADVVASLRALAERGFDGSPEPPATAAAEDASSHDPDPSDAARGVLRGYAASPGLAVGPARRFQAPVLTISGTGGASVTDPAAESATLDRALDETATAIERQRDQIAARAGERAAEIFDAHLLFLRDDALLQPARHAIDDEGSTAAMAWQGAIDATSSSWDELDDAYLRARVDDLRSVGTQVLARIVGVEVPAPRLEAPGVLVVEDLTPADTAGLDPALVLGVATARGGPTSHAAVITRSMAIPAVVGLGDGLLTIVDGVTVAIDGGLGELTVDPAPNTIAQLETERRTRAASAGAARAAALEPATTIDGTTIEVAASIGVPDEVAAAVAAGADGIGLFRTEFLFMDRESAPDEEEQVQAYRAAGEALAGRPLLLRTLDAGADKPIPYLEQPPEPNPFLGVRGVRLGLARPELLRTQLRAMMRVADEHPVRVMFPMVATIDELDRALALLREVRDDLGTTAPMETGVMVEVPSAAMMASKLAARIDFLSIGTNDLTQYTLAADRGNERVADLTDALHPAVLRLIRITVDGAVASGRWVGVCGELAADPAATPLLLGLGIRELSMSVPSIAIVKDAVRSVDLAGARAMADAALALDDASSVRSFLAQA